MRLPETLYACFCRPCGQMHVLESYIEGARCPISNTLIENVIEFKNMTVIRSVPTRKEAKNETSRGFTFKEAISI